MRKRYNEHYVNLASLAAKWLARSARVQACGGFQGLRAEAAVGVLGVGRPGFGAPVLK